VAGVHIPAGEGDGPADCQPAVAAKPMTARSAAVFAMTLRGAKVTAAGNCGLSCSTTASLRMPPSSARGKTILASWLSDGAEP